MSVSIKTADTDETLEAMNTPGVTEIEIAKNEDGVFNADAEKLGLAPVWADKSGRLWRADRNKLTLVSDWKR